MHSDHIFEPVEPEAWYWRTRVEWELADAVLLLINLEPRKGRGEAVRLALDNYERRCYKYDLTRDRCWSKVREELEQLVAESPPLADVLPALEQGRHIYENALVAAQRYDLDTHTEFKSSYGMVHAIRPHTFLRWAHRHHYAIPEAFGELIGNPPSLEELKRENTQLRETVAKLTAELEHAYGRFDPHSPQYPRELDIANLAWRTVSNENPATAGTVRQRLERWITKAYSSLNRQEVKRIATVANWDKQRGNKSPGK